MSEYPKSGCHALLLSGQRVSDLNIARELNSRDKTQRPDTLALRLRRKAWHPDSSPNSFICLPS
jgi:hypothetical protein